MHTSLRLLLLAPLLLVSAAAAQDNLCLPGSVPLCPFSSGSTGAINLAPTQDMQVALPDDGVLMYDQINIPAGVTVTFTRNASNTPVLLLAKRDVTIAGTIDVRGTDASGPTPGRGGPGGFDGGRGDIASPSAGLGPGGGTVGVCAGNSNYLNTRLIPLLGGSGGSGLAGITNFGYGGGGGGGAILIATSGMVNFTGTILTVGGGAPATGCNGSPGGVRIIAQRVQGNGSVGAGVLRIEACDIASRYDGYLSSCFPGGCGAAFSFDCPSAVVAAGLPTLRITMIANQTPKPTPSGSYDADPDVSLPEGTTSAAVLVAATGIPPGTMITVTAVPRRGTVSSATASLGGTLQSTTATANVALVPGRSIISARATVNITPDAGAPLVYGGIAGERIASLKIDATYGGGSSIVYVTESGREIPVAAN